MVFKRRDRRPLLTLIREFLWPRGGWTRAFHYVKHRVNRLPDRPHRVARGVFAGVFISFTPLFGFHFLGAAGVAILMRGNVLAALLATFFGNPLTTPIIAVSSVELGRWMLGRKHAEAEADTLVQTFLAAGADLKHNLFALFNSDVTHWGGLVGFFHDVWLPYMVGGIIPGIICSAICYYLTIPLVDAYQKRRRARLKDRLDTLRARLEARREDRHKGGPGEPR